MENLFLKYSIEELLLKIDNKEISYQEIVDYTINKIDGLNKNYHCFVCSSKEILAEQMKEAKKWRQQGGQGLLEGMPVGVKDIMNTVDFPTQMGSPSWRDFTPGNDARVVFNVKRQGAIIPGKTVTAEFAVHYLNETINPHDASLTPGTSSSGSAVAVATGMVPVALGTQTAGSIIRPASFCGVYGCKPSFGTIPRTGILKTTDTLDSVGFFVSHAVDLKRVFDSLRVHGQNYPISNRALSNTERQSKPANRAWRIAFVKTYTWPGALDYVKNSLENFLQKLSTVENIQLTEVELPVVMQAAHKTHEIIYNKALSYYFQKEFKNPGQMSDIMKLMIATGQEISADDYKEALARQVAMTQVMDDFFSDYDIIISLSTSSAAPLRTEIELPDPSLIWTLTGLPVVSAPAFKSPAGLPFGLQIVAIKYNDYLLLNFLDFLVDHDLIPTGPNPLFLES